MSNHNIFPSFDDIPEPSDDELYVLTAEDYLASLTHFDEASIGQREGMVAHIDVQHEIDAQVALINELVEDFNRFADEGTAAAIEEAKHDLGWMLVDKNNLPPV